MEDKRRKILYVPSDELKYPLTSIEYIIKFTSQNKGKGKDKRTR